MTGGVVWTGGNISSPLTVNVNYGATLSIDNQSAVDLGGVLDNAGTATWSGASIDGQTGGAIANEVGGLFTDTGANSYTGPGSFTNEGTFNNATGAASTYFGVPFNNAGTVNVASGGLVLALGGAFSSCAFNVAAADEISFPLDAYGYSASSVLSGTISFTGNGLVVVSGGTLTTGTSSATLSVADPTTFDLSSGGLGASVGTTLNLEGAFAFLGSSAFDLEGGGTVNVAGTLDQTNAGSLSIKGSDDSATTLNIDNGSVYNIQGDGSILSADNGGTIVNNGTIEKTVGTGVSTIAAALDSVGIVAVYTGTIDVTGAVSQVIGSPLAAGTWDVTGTPTIEATLSFGSPAMVNGQWARAKLSRREQARFELGHATGLPH